MSYWDFSRPPAGQQDAPEPGGQDDAAYPDAAYPDAAYPDNTRIPGESWPPRDYWATEDSWPAGNDPARDDGSPADGGWPPDEPWPADNGWTRRGSWPADNARADNDWAGGGQADNGWPDDSGLADGGLADIGLADADADDGEGTALYPVTYERAPFPMAGVMPAVPRLDDDERWPPAPYPEEPGAPGAHEDTAVLRDDPAISGYGEETADSTDGRPGDASWRKSAWPGRRGPGVAGREWPGQVPGEPGHDWGYQANGGRRGGTRRWLIPAAVVVAGAAVGAAAVLLVGGHPNGQASQGAGRPTAPLAPPSKAASRAAGTRPATTPPVASFTITQAQHVLAGYTTVNNQANAQRSDTLLATIEAGSSYAIDAGLYQTQSAAGARPYPPFGPVQATYYIPRAEPAGGPRWFVVQVGNAFTANPAKVTSAEYLLFTQQAPGDPWLDTIEPYLLAGASAPQVAVGADGMATAVAPHSATLAVAPGQLPAATAAALDSAVGGPAAITTPGNVADLADQQSWRAAVPGGQVSDVHAPAAGADGQEFALATADGGALVFYTDSAQVTVTPPPGAQLQLTVPGFISPGQALIQARVNYLEQFAAYDPPAAAAAAGGGPRVVADYSAITGAG